jgi:hypothetical protein
MAALSVGRGARASVRPAKATDTPAATVYNHFRAAIFFREELSAPADKPETGRKT